jgi:hypothetical protein
MICPAGCCSNNHYWLTRLGFPQGIGVFQFVLSFIVTKTEGRLLLDALGRKLAPSNLGKLRQTFIKARSWMSSRPREGIPPKNYPIDYFPENGRIDVEVRIGSAFIDDNFNWNPTPLPSWST